MMNVLSFVLRTLLGAAAITLAAAVGFGLFCLWGLLWVSVTFGAFVEGELTFDILAAHALIGTFFSFMLVFVGGIVFGVGTAVWEMIQDVLNRE